MVGENEPRCGNCLSRTSCATPYTNMEKIEEKSGIDGECVQEMEVTVESDQCEVVEVDDDADGDQRTFSSVTKIWKSSEIRSDTVNPSDITSYRAYLPN